MVLVQRVLPSTDPAEKRRARRRRLNTAGESTTVSTSVAPSELAGDEECEDEDEDLSDFDDEDEFQDAQEGAFGSHNACTRLGGL